MRIDKETEEILEKLRRFIADEIQPLENKYLSEDFIPHPEHMKVRRLSKEAGFYSAYMPEDIGGRGLKILDTCLVVEEIFKLGCERFGEDIYGGIGGPHPVLAEISRAQIDKYLMPLMRAEKTICFALTEPGAGSDISAQETFAKKNRGMYLLKGRKFLITNAVNADFAVISAVTDPDKGLKAGLSCFIVEKQSPGYSVNVQDTLMRDGMQGEIILDDVEVPAENLLIEEGAGYKIIQDWIAFERMLLSATCVGVAQRLLDLCLSHSLTRVQFKEPLSKQQAIQIMLADMATELCHARMMLYQIAWRMDQKEKLSSEISILKLFATEMAGRAADTAFQIFAGRASLRQFPIERIFRRTRLFRLMLGTSEIQRMLIARSLLKTGGSSQ